MQPGPADHTKANAGSEHTILAGPCSESLAEQSRDYFTDRDIAVVIDRLEGRRHGGFVVVEALS